MEWAGEETLIDYSLAAHHPSATRLNGSSAPERGSTHFDLMLVLP
jgi:hypothetical protein